MPRTWILLFTRDEHNQGLAALAVPETTFEAEEELQQEGWQLQWDSASSTDEAYQYAAEHLHAYQSACCYCGTFARLELMTGQRFCEDRRKWIVFRGRLCPMCQENRDDLRTRYVR